MILKKIETLCRKNKITVSALEKTLGFGNSTITKWNKGSPTVDKLKKVADYFGCTIDDLIEDKKRKK